MPNPLSRIGTPNRSKGKPEGKPEALAPLIETVDGQTYVNPYRGLEDHGVDPTGKYAPVEEWDGEADEVYDKPEKDAPTPIPVKVVSEDAKEEKRFRVSPAYARQGGALVVNRNDGTSKVTLRNAGISTVFISERVDLATAENGWPLDAGKELVLSTNREVYAGTADSAQVRVLALIEYAS